MRRHLPRALFGLGCLLLTGAAFLLLLSRTLPSEGLQDLGRVVGAMLLAALSFPFFVAALLLAGRDELPRWMRAVSLTGALIALVPALALLL